MLAFEGTLQKNYLEFTFLSFFYYYAENMYFYFFSTMQFLNYKYKKKIKMGKYIFFFPKIRRVVNMMMIIIIIRRKKLYNLVCIIKKCEGKRKNTEFQKIKRETTLELDYHIVIFCKRKEENALSPFSNHRVPHLVVIFVYAVASMYFSSTGLPGLLLKLSAFTIYIILWQGMPP